jgi:hypothetical protein
MSAITFIQGIDCIGDSRTTINNNFSALDVRIQQVSGLATNINSSAPAIIDVNSSSTALRVTQRGSGNVILIEDSANPDTTPFVVTGAGNVGIGTTAPNQKLTVVGAISSTETIFASGGNSNNWNSTATSFNTNNAGLSTALTTHVSNLSVYSPTGTYLGFIPIYQ